MKKIILTISITIFTLTVSFSQDIILKKSGDEIRAKVIEVNIDNIKYKVFENIDGPIYTISKTEVFMIKYQNGSKDVFKEIEQIKEIEQRESEQISHTKTEPFRKGIYLGLHITPGAGAIFRKMDENTKLNFGINSGADVCIYFNDYVGIKTGFSFLSIPINYEYFSHYYDNNGSYRDKYIKINDKISSIGIPIKFLLTTGETVGFYLESGLTVYFPVSSTSDNYYGKYNSVVISGDGVLGLNIKASKIINLNFGVSSHYSVTNYYPKETRGILIGLQVGLLFKLSKQ